MRQTIHSILGLLGSCLAVNVLAGIMVAGMANSGALYGSTAIDLFLLAAKSGPPGLIVLATMIGGSARKPLSNGEIVGILLATTATAAAIYFGNLWVVFQIGAAV